MGHQEFTGNGNTVKIEGIKNGLMYMHYLYIKRGGNYVDAAAASGYKILHESRNFAECEVAARKIDASYVGITK